MKFSLGRIIPSAYGSIIPRLYLYTASIVLFFLIVISISIWTGNTLAMITSIARFERTHTVSRNEAMVALLKFLEFNEAAEGEIFKSKMAITQSYNRAFSILPELRKTKTDAECARILEDTFKEADQKMAEIIVNRLLFLSWNPIFKEMVNNAARANTAGEKIKVLVDHAMAERNTVDRRALLDEVKKLEKDFVSYEISFSEHCSELSDEVSRYVSYFYITLLCLSVGFTGLLMYMTAKTILQQAEKNRLILKNEILEREQAEKHLALQNQIAEIFLAAPDEEMYNQVLTVVLNVMQSPFGVFGYLDEAGDLVVPTMTWQIWDKCQVDEKTMRFPRETWGDSSWVRAIREKKTNYTNEPSKKIPKGHVMVERHISLPIILGGEVLGLFQVANKESDYTEADVQRLQSIANHSAPILRAILARERYEKSLQEKNAELIRFNYAVSHDLKSPLVTIKNFLGLLDKDINHSNAEQIAQDLGFINSAADKMYARLEELLNLSRLEHKKNPFEETTLQDIVQEALLLTAGRIDKQGVRVQVTNEPILLYGDRARLVEVFQNLIDNAAKFMAGQSGSLVEIGASANNNEVLLCVRDNGPGIDLKYKDTIFGLFEKLNPEIEGTGMGLALVKRIVEMHGGKIWVESEGPGTGACFRFTLQGKSSV